MRIATLILALAAFSRPAAAQDVPLDGYCRVVRSEGKIVGIYYGCHAEVTDAHLAALCAFPELRELGILRSEITDAGLAALADLRALEYLRINSSKISGPGLATIASLPKLRELALVQTPVGADGLKLLKGAAALRSLSLFSISLDGDAVAALQQLKTLEVLRVNRTARSKGAELAVQLPKLELTVFSQYTARVFQPSLSVQPELVRSRVRPDPWEGCRVYHRGDEPTGGIVRADLTCTAREPGSILAGLKSYPDLREFGCYSDILEAPDFDRLKELTQLDSITLSRTSLERLESLASLPRLRSLRLAHVSLTPEARKALKTLPGLEDLKLDQMTLTEESLNFLPELKGLKSLTLRVYGIERAKLATLVDRMPDTSITFERP